MDVHRVFGLTISTFVAGLLAACGGGGGSTADVSEPESIARLDPSSGVGEFDQGTFSVKIVADRLKGNAPLEVHFDAEVVGCDPTNTDFLWTFAAGSFSDSRTTSFVFNGSGYFTVKLQGTCRANGVTDEDSTQIQVLDSAELTLSQVQVVSSTTLVPGGTLELTFELFNKGDRIDQPFLLDIVVSKDELYQADKDIILREITVPSLEDGRNKVVKNTYIAEPASLPPDVPLGSYFVFVVADPDNRVQESDESNNVAQATSFITVKDQSEDQADVAVSSPDFPEGTQVVPGHAIPYSLTISNVGTAVLKNFKYAVFGSIDTGLSPDDFKMTSDELTTVFKMEPGKPPLTLYASLFVPKDTPLGKYYAIAQVDVNHVLPDIDLQNNVAVSPWTFEVIEDPAKVYDLAVTSVSVSPHSTYWNGSVKVTATVANLGKKASPAFPFAFYLSENPSPNVQNDTKAKSGQAASIPPGGTYEMVEVVPIPKGTLAECYLSLVVGQIGSTEEPDVSNNWGSDSKVLTVAKNAFIDVSLSDLVVHPAEIAAGKDLKVSYLVRNTGSTASGAFVNWIVLSQDKTVSAADVKNGKDILVLAQPVDAVEPSTETERVEKVPIPLALPHDVDRYYVGVIGDAEGFLTADSNKSNQTLVSQTQIKILDLKGGCYEDALEPNNGWQEAIPLKPGKTDQLGLCGGEDWFSVEMTAGQSLVVGLESSSPLFLTPRSYDVDLEIRSPDGEVLDVADTTGEKDMATAFAVPESGKYGIRIYPKEIGAQAHYFLDVAIQDPGPGVDLMPLHVKAFPDGIYPGGLLAVTATVVNLGKEPAPESTAHLFLNEGIEASTDGEPILTVKVPALAGTSKTDVKAAVLLPIALEGGPYSVTFVADGNATVAETDETNNTGVSGVIMVDESMVCEDDGLEPNDEPEVATVLEPQSTSYPDLTVCPDLPDVFRVDLPEGVSFTVGLTYDHKPDKGFLAVEILDEGRVAILDAAVTSTSPLVGLPYVYHTGTYFIRVRVAPVSGKAGPYKYSMALNVGVPLPGDVCAGDGHEPNNAFADATPIGCGMNRLTLCRKDRDYFRIPVANGGAVSVTLGHAKAELKASLYLDPLGKSIKSVNGNGSMDYVADADSILYLAVEPKSASTPLTDYAYTLFVQGVSGRDLSLDGVSVFPAEVWQGEDVQVSFKASNGCSDAVQSYEYRLFLSTNPVLEPMDVPILTGTEGKGLAGASEIERVVKAMVPLQTAPGNYYVIVALDPLDQVEESQEDNNIGSALLGVAKVCLPDALEPNDVWHAASTLLPGIYTQLVICPNDIDWFRVQVGAGAEIHVEVKQTPGGGDLDLRLYAAGDPVVPVAVSATQNGVESVDWIAQEAGEYRIRVTGFLGEASPYTLVVGVKESK